jgi:pilus assembly protein CpaD
MKPLSLAVVAAALLASACATQKPRPEDAASVRSTSRYALEATERQAELMLAVRDDGLSQAQRQALAEVALQPGRGPVTLIAAGSPREQAHLEAARRFLSDVGVRDVQVLAEPALSEGRPVVKVAYERLAGKIHDCSAFWGDMTRSRNNQTHLNLGCAVTSNMALQVADPNDLRRPQAETPADSARRATVMDAYRRGEPTAARSDDRDSARIVKTVQ